MPYNIAKLAILCTALLSCYGTEDVHKNVKVPLNPERFLDVTGSLLNIDHLGGGDLAYESKVRISKSNYTLKMGIWNPVFKTECDTCFPA